LLNQLLFSSVCLLEENTRSFDDMFLVKSHSVIQTSARECAETNQEGTFLSKKKKREKNIYVFLHTRKYTVAKMENRDLHYTSLPRDELPLNSAIQFHLEMQAPYSFLSFSLLSARWGHSRTSLMDLIRRIRCVWSQCFFYDIHYALYV